MRNDIYNIPRRHISFDVNGAGDRGLLIILDKGDLEANAATLTGLIKAIKFTDDDVSIITTDHQSIDINSLVTSDRYQSLFLIGISAHSVDFNMNAQKYFQYRTEHIKILLTDSLAKMNQETSLKMKFWQILQQAYLS